MRCPSSNHFISTAFILLSLAALAYGRVFWSLGRSADVMRRLQAHTPIQPYATRVLHNGNNHSFSLFTLSEPLGSTLAHIRAGFPDAALEWSGGTMALINIPAGTSPINLLALSNESTGGTLVFVLDAVPSITIPVDASSLPPMIPSYPGARYHFAVTLEINKTTLVMAETTDDPTTVARRLDSDFRQNRWTPRLPSVPQTGAFQVYERSDAVCCVTVTGQGNRSTTRIAWLHKPRAVE